MRGGGIEVRGQWSPLWLACPSPRPTPAFANMASVRRVLVLCTVLATTQPALTASLRGQQGSLLPDLPEPEPFAAPAMPDLGGATEATSADASGLPSLASLMKRLGLPPVTFSEPSFPRFQQEKQDDQLSEQVQQATAGDQQAQQAQQAEDQQAQQAQQAEDQQAQQAQVQASGDSGQPSSGGPDQAEAQAQAQPQTGDQAQPQAQTGDQLPTGDKLPPILPEGFELEGQTPPPADPGHLDLAADEAVALLQQSSWAGQGHGQGQSMWQAPVGATGPAAMWPAQGQNAVQPAAPDALAPLPTGPEDKNMILDKTGAEILQDAATGAHAKANPAYGFPDMKQYEPQLSPVKNMAISGFPVEMGQQVVNPSATPEEQLKDVPLGIGPDGLPRRDPATDPLAHLPLNGAPLLSMPRSGLYGPNVPQMGGAMQGTLPLPSYAYGLGMGVPLPSPEGALAIDAGAAIPAVLPVQTVPVPVVLSLIHI